MPYVENRIVHDADSHLMELPDCARRVSRSAISRALRCAAEAQEAAARRRRTSSQARAKQDDPLFRNTAADENILLRKNYEALGSFKREDRPRALDDLGFASQLIFTTWCLGNFDLDQSGDVGLCYAAARAHNRMMSEFCSVDRRFLGTGYVPLVSFEAALATATRGHRLGLQGAADSFALPAGDIPQPRRLRSAVGAGARSPAADRVPCRRRGEAEARLFQQRPAAGEGFPRRRGEFHLLELHADPALGTNHAGRADHRRRAGSSSAIEIWRHRARRILGAELDALHGFRRRPPSSRTRSGCRSCR